MIRIGPAGWSYKDWSGIVYPEPKPRGFHEAEYLAKFFDTIEVNTSFYGPIKPQTAKNWVQRVAGNPDFKFTAKLWRGFTHERNATAADEKAVKDGLEPLVAANRLGGLLLQFPWSFKNSEENRQYCLNLHSRFREYPLVLEVRHSSWNEARVLEFLSELGIGICNIDQPIFSRSIRPGALTTSSLGYVRLHGRNYQQWFTENQQTGDRYNYLYSVDELAPWVDRVKTIAREAKDTYVITNNHFVGKAVVNAFEMTALLTDRPLHPPPELIERYPRLQELAAGGEYGKMRQ